MRPGGFEDKGSGARRCPKGLLRFLRFVFDSRLLGRPLRLFECFSGEGPDGCREDTLKADVNLELRGVTCGCSALSSAALRGFRLEEAVPEVARLARWFERAQALRTRSPARSPASVLVCHRRWKFTGRSTSVTATGPDPTCTRSLASGRREGDFVG